eukprot:766421-Hanusia_phi.AAC.1
MQDATFIISLERAPGYGAAQTAAGWRDIGLFDQEDTGEDRCVCVPPERLNENGFKLLANCTEENQCYQN